jgi:hypothetical protein
LDLRATSPSHPIPQVDGAARACLCALWLAWGAQLAPAARQEAVQAIISRDRTNTVVIGQCKGQAIVAGSDARLRKPLQDDVLYTTQAMSQDLLRVQNAWDECQSHRERDAIYSYLTAVFDLVAWWAADNCALARAQKALRLQNIWPSDPAESGHRDYSRLSCAAGEMPLGHAHALTYPKTFARGRSRQTALNSMCASAGLGPRSFCYTAMARPLGLDGCGLCSRLPTS